MGVAARSWSSFSSKFAREYLRTYGHPALGSKQIVCDLLKRLNKKRPIRVLDLGCGNAQILESFLERELQFDYTGVDFSDALLAAAEDRFGAANIRFVRDDVCTLEKIEGPFDAVLYSHVLEMVESPGATLRRAAQLARCIMIRFFEPPADRPDLAELREMEVAPGVEVPYIRWSMSTDYYQLLLSWMNAKSVDVYHDDSSRDQVHVIHVDSEEP